MCLFCSSFILYLCFLQLPGKLNELDNNGDLALDLALSRKLESIATTLVNNKADVDMVDQSGWSLLHKAIQRGAQRDLVHSLWCFFSFAQAALFWPVKFACFEMFLLLLQGMSLLPSF